jgi:hypothetical protein
MILADIEEFLRDHRAHGRLEGAVGEATANGYMLTIACPCGVTFRRWVAPVDAVVNVALLARFN